MDRDVLRNMISEIEKELNSLAELRKEMDEIKSQESIIFRRSKGSILHDFYNGCERIFKKIAIDINGGHEDTEKWHKALLFKWGHLGGGHSNTDEHDQIESLPL